MTPNSLVLKWPDRSLEHRRTGGPGVSVPGAAATRLPSGHPEGYLEAFAVLYRNFARAIRAQLVSEISVEARRYLVLIRSLMAVLPLLGLLGTVSGMILVFESMAVSGTGSARLMAGGVSAATIPTMSGLVAALSGLYLVTYLDQRANREVKRTEDLLTH